MNWNAKDEEAYRLAVKTAKELTERRTEALERVASLLDLIPVEDGYFADAATEALVRNADRIRDALAPFDSGHRPAKEQA